MQGKECRGGQDISKETGEAGAEAAQVYRRFQRFQERQRQMKKKLTPLEKMISKHTSTCTVHTYSGDRHCSCGRDEAAAELAELRASLDKLVRYLVNEALVNTDDMQDKESPLEAIKIIAKLRSRLARAERIEHALRYMQEKYHGDDPVASNEDEFEEINIVSAALEEKA